MQEHVGRYTDRKALATLSSVVLKHLLENKNCVRMYNSGCFTVIGREEISLRKGGSPEKHKQVNSPLSN